MPTYVYKRDDGTTFEIQQRITADALDTCPTTGQKVRRIPSAGAGLVFKGSGFYQTDYVRRSDGSTPDGSGRPAPEKPASDAPAEAPAAKPDPAPSAPASAPAPATAGASTPGSAGST